MAQNDGERKIKEFIDQFRAAEMPNSSVKCSRRRNSPTPSARSRQPTKAAAESQRIAGNKIEQAMTRLDRLKPPSRTSPKPFSRYAPIVLQDGARRVMRLGRYHCRKPGGRFIDRNCGALARGATAGQVLASWRVACRDDGQSFFENVDRDGKNQVLHFVPRPAGFMPAWPPRKDPKEETVVVIRGHHR
jgi:hypothetical protein